MSRSAAGLVVIGFVLAACGSSEAASTSTTVQETTTTTIDRTTVFEEGALEALIDSIVADLGIEDLGSVPVPDLTNPDLLTVQDDVNSFVAWVLTTAPDPAWAKVFTASGSPAREGWELAFGSLADQGARAVYLEGSRTGSALELEPSTGVSPAFRSLLPDNAVVVTYLLQIGTLENRRFSDEQVVSSFEPRSKRVSSALVPTELGWQVWAED